MTDTQNPTIEDVLARTLQLYNALDNGNPTVLYHRDMCKELHDMLVKVVTNHNNTTKDACKADAPMV